MAGGAELGDDAFDGGADQVGVGRVADVHGMIDDDPVDGVDDLGFVAELHGTAEAAFADRAGVGFMQRHEPGRAVGLVAVDAGAGLGDDPVGALDEHGELVEQATHPPPASLVLQGFRRFGDRRLGEISQATGDHQHFGFGFVAAASQPRPDRMLMGPRLARCGRCRRPSRRGGPVAAAATRSDPSPRSTTPNRSGT